MILILFFQILKYLHLYINCKLYYNKQLFIILKSYNSNNNKKKLLKIIKKNSFLALSMIY